MFKITDENINEVTNGLLLGKDFEQAGGIVSFQGTVRNHNEGKTVIRLEYDAYRPMAKKIGAAIVEDAIKRFDLLHAVCVHRVGALEINDTAVWVVAAAKHRKEAFEAAKHIIDQVKAQVPIWKREHYEEEPPKWIACHGCAEAGKRKEAGA